MRRCRDVIKKTDLYDILGVARDVSEEQLKKAYKKMALRFHPDKNRAPNATEAFKKVNQAFACLNDKEKRKYYDVHGREAKFEQNYQQHFNQSFYEPEDIFEMFFGPGFGAQMHHRRRA